MRSTPEQIGFDPVVWVDRLLDVNEGSAFTDVQKGMIRATLQNLRRNLEKRGEL